MARLSSDGARICLIACVLALIGGYDIRIEARDLNESEANEPVFVGVMSRQEIERALPDWIEEEINSRPDVRSADSLVADLAGAEVIVLLGTWCSDSRRELARLWRAFDEVGVVSPSQFRYVGVDREMSAPEEWVEGSDLKLVPTFIVKRQGREIGRIVESSPNGIEVDLLALLSGESSGVITGSDEPGLADDER